MRKSLLSVILLVIAIALMAIAGCSGCAGGGDVIATSTNDNPTATNNTVAPSGCPTANSSTTTPATSPLPSTTPEPNPSPSLVFIKEVNTGNDFLDKIHFDRENQEIISAGGFIKRYNPNLEPVEPTIACTPVDFAYRSGDIYYGFYLSSYNQIMVRDTNPTLAIPTTDYPSCGGYPIDMSRTADGQNHILIAQDSQHVAPTMIMLKNINGSQMSQDWYAWQSCDVMPHSITFDNAGNLYAACAASSSRDGIFCFDNNGYMLLEEYIQITNPIQIETDRERQNLFVLSSSDNQYWVTKVNIANKTKTKFSLCCGSDEGQVTNPKGLTLDLNDNIFISDKTRKMILKFTIR